MTPPIYSVIDGVQREITAIPVVIDGVERELEAVTATVQGVEREVFSSKPLYVWEKYTYADEFVVDTSEKVSLKLSQISGDGSKITKYNGDVPSSGTSTTFGSAIKVGTYIVAVDGSVYQATQEYSGVVLISGLSCYRVTVKTGKGDLIETVEGDSPDAYPTNGLHTDGYWYVLVTPI